MSDPDQAVAEYLDAVVTSPLSFYTLGTNLFRGPIRAPSTTTFALIPNRAIFVLAYGGPSPLDKFNGEPIQRHGVQVMIRGEINTFATTQADARACYDALHLANLNNGYLRCAAIQPAYLGFDDTEHPLFSLNLDLWREP